MSAPVSSRVVVAAPADRVFEVLTSDAWVEARAARFRDGATLVRREERPDGGLVLVVSRELPEGAPAFVQRLLPADRRVLQTDEWGPAEASGARSGTWSVELPGTPARLGGTLRLEPADAGTAYLQEGSARVQIPLVGGKVERYVAEMAGRLAAGEGELLRRTAAG